MEKAEGLSARRPESFGPLLIFAGVIFVPQVEGTLLKRARWSQLHVRENS